MKFLALVGAAAVVTIEKLVMSGVLATPNVVDSTQGERLGGRREVEGLLGLGVDLLPLVPARGRHQAAPLLERIAIGRRGLNSARGYRRARASGVG